MDDLADAFAAPGRAVASIMADVGGRLDAMRAEAEQRDRITAAIGSELVGQRQNLEDQRRMLDGLEPQIRSLDEGAERQWQLLAAVNISLGKVADILEHSRRQKEREEARRASNIPIYHDFAKELISGVTAPDLAFSFGGPAQGRIWHVKRLVVGGQTLADAVSGSAEVYVSGYVPTTSTSLSDLHDATILISSPQTDLPNIGNYEDGQMVVQAGEKLWVIIRSPSASTMYVVAGTAKDVRVDLGTETVAVSQS